MCLAAAQCINQPIKKAYEAENLKSDFLWQVDKSSLLQTHVADIER